MSSVIEINSSEDELENNNANNDDEVVVLSGEVDDIGSPKNNNEPAHEIDLTNDRALADLIKDLSSTNTKFTNEFLRFLQLSYDLESSDGMKRIIMKNLVPSYSKADKQYLESKRFKIFILNSVYKLNTDSNHKFTHLKEVCDVLKSKSATKRVQLVSLGKHTTEPRKKQQVKSKGQKCETIDLDQISDAEISNDVVILGEGKENNHTEESINGVHLDNTENELNSAKVSETKFQQEESISVSQYQISQLETRIRERKMCIEHLETQEVNLDDEYSPYIRLDSLKAELVMLYKRLYALKGEDLTYKTKQIKLYPADGRHPGPSQKLESWLNSHTEENGMPQFPDLFDVVKCVTEANVEWGLSWDKQRILDEARLLFTQCGKALQRRRQRRGWRELARAAGAGGHDPAHDPAARDPALRARLDENRRQAMKREACVMDHYVTMDEEQRAKKRYRRAEPEPFVNDSVTPSEALNNGPSTSSTSPNTLLAASLIKNNTIEPDLQKNTTNCVPNDIALPNINDYVSLQALRLNSYIESQMDNENNTNIEIGNNEIEDPSENESVEDDDSGVQIEQYIPMKSDEAQLNIEVELEGSQECNATVKAEFEDIEETDTVVGYSQLVSGNNPTDVIKVPLNESGENKTNDSNNTKTEVGDVVVKIKTEIKTENDDTLKRMLEFDEEISDTVITTVFDIEEPVVFIEISSSEDESDSDLEYIDKDGPDS